MNYQLRDQIAHDMWHVWKKVNLPESEDPACPDEFYLMAQIAMKHVCKSVDDMILNAIKQRLEKLV